MNKNTDTNANTHELLSKLLEKKQQIGSIDKIFGVGWGVCVQKNLLKKGDYKCNSSK